MSETVYINRDNIVDLILYSDGIAQDLSSVTKIAVKIDDVEIENEVSTAWPIKWSGIGVDGKIRLKLGDQFTENHRGRLYIILYDADNLDGIVWGYVDAVITSV